MPSTPCHVIAGPLGVGKTTAILHYLREHASTQRVGVLVNDFGPVGLDSATLQAEAPGTKVLNVPGGCICCTMLAELPKSIKRLVSEQQLDRLIIEPTGMAAPAQVIDLLRSLQGELNISLQPTVAMLSAVDFDEDTFETRPYYHMFCEAGDILVFNRCDQVSEAKIERAQQWGGKLDPPKLRVLTTSTSHGQLPPELFEANVEEVQPQEPAKHGCGHEHNHDHGHNAHDPTVRPGGFTLDAEQCFNQEQLVLNLIRICHQGIDGNQVLRLKGVFTIEIANREVSFRPSSHRRDNRMEWLTQPEAVDDARMLEEIGRPLDKQAIVELLEGN